MKTLKGVAYCHNNKLKRRKIMYDELPENERESLSEFEETIACIGFWIMVIFTIYLIFWGE